MLGEVCLLCGDLLPLFKALKTNMLIALKNVNTDLPLLASCGVGGRLAAVTPLYRFLHRSAIWILIDA